MTEIAPTLRETFKVMCGKHWSLYQAGFLNPNIKTPYSLPPGNELKTNVLILIHCTFGASSLPQPTLTKTIPDPSDTSQDLELPSFYKKPELNPLLFEHINSYRKNIFLVSFSVL